MSVSDCIVIEEVVIGKSLLIGYVGQRSGEPAILVAKSALACQTLGWTSQYSELNTIFRHAREFEKNHFIRSDIET